MGSNAQLPEAAISSLKRKEAFWNFLWIPLAVSAAVVIIWWFSTPGGYFVHAWLSLGYVAFRKPGPLEKKIEQETARLRKSDPN